MVFLTQSNSDQKHPYQKTLRKIAALHERNGSAPQRQKQQKTA
jgi:hypothetical protein